MNFKSAVTPLGKGSLAYAAASADKADILIRRLGAIERVKVDLKTKAVRYEGRLSLAEECLPTATGRIEKIGEIYYVADD